MGNKLVKANKLEPMPVEGKNGVVLRPASRV